MKGTLKPKRKKVKDKKLDTRMELLGNHDYVKIKTSY